MFYFFISLIQWNTWHSLFDFIKYNCTLVNILTLKWRPPLTVFIFPFLNHTFLACAQHIIFPWRHTMGVNWFFSVEFIRSTSSQRWKWLVFNQLYMITGSNKQTPVRVKCVWTMCYYWLRCDNQKLLVFPRQYSTEEKINAVEFCNIPLIYLCNICIWQVTWAMEAHIAVLHHDSLTPVLISHWNLNEYGNTDFMSFTPFTNSLAYSQLHSRERTWNNRLLRFKTWSVTYMMSTITPTLLMLVRQFV